MAGQAVKLSTYSSAADFLTKAQAWLEKERAVNGLMLGIALRLKQFPERIDAAALMTLPWNVGVASDREDCAGALEMIARDIVARQRDVPGTIGAAHVADEFARIWTKVSGKKHAINRRERLFELHQVNAHASSQGKMRQAIESDLELVARWAVDFTNEALGGQNVAGIPETIKRQIRDHDIFLWEDTKPVALAARTRPTTDGIIVSLVYTPPESRRRGYATSLAAQLSQALLDSGFEYCTLFTDLANPISNHIYQKNRLRGSLRFQRVSV